MTYPPAPWMLKGKALYSLQLIDINQASRFIPPELEIVSILPGKTLGAVYLSAYESGSILEYNELIVSAALVRHQGKVASWISHIYVDHETSVVGGREIWGLPKEMAQFTWYGQKITVSQTDQTLCTFEYQNSWFNLSTFWKQQLKGDCFGVVETELLWFTSQFKSNMSIVKGSLKVPKESPFFPLSFNQPFLTLKLSQLELLAGKPERLGAQISPIHPVFNLV